MKQVKWLILVLILVLMGCGQDEGKGQRLTLIEVPRSSDGAILGIAKLPSPYYEYTHDGGGRYTNVKLRASRKGVDAEVLIRPYEYRTVLSDEYYAVTTDGKFIVRKARLGEWENAEPEESRDDTNAPNDVVIRSGLSPHTVRGREQRDSQPLTFRGKSFPASGLQGGRAFGSATGKYLASWSKTVKPVATGFTMPAPGLGRGEIDDIYLEIFDVATGKLLLSAFSNELGGVKFGSWLNDRYFVLPYSGGDVNGNMPFCFLAIMPVR